MVDSTHLQSQFADLSPTRPTLFRAPGRVNLIGEHTDYNAGFVMPAALQFDTTLAAAERPTPRLRIRSLDFDETVEIDLADRAALEASRPRRHWSDYVVGVILELWNLGVEIRGADLLIHSDIPLGSGLSSSASFEVGLALTLSEMARHSLDRLSLATLSQRAENRYVGMRCGIMDQFASAFGQANHALALDCRSLDYQPVSLIAPDTASAGASLVICNTMVRHTHAGGEYNRRRAECELAVAALSNTRAGVRDLRDVSLGDLKVVGHQMDPILYRRAHHVISENQRVSQAVEALSSGDSSAFGRLMSESHRSLRDDFEVSCAELDLMVTIAEEIDGVYGARMTGGGFGGCTVNWVRTDAVEHFGATVRERYRKAIGLDPAIYLSAAADGASRLND